MEQNIRANIGGFIFNLSAPAYRELEIYFNKIEEAYDSEDAKEISKDIEFRIAELLKDKGKDSETITELEDILEILEQLGYPFDEEYDDETNQNQTYQGKKPLFRHPEDRYLGGVSAGLGLWLNMNPNIVRAIFILLTFLNGLGILIYAVLWIITPEAQSRTQLLMMQGKAPTVDNLAGNIKNEFHYLKKSLHSLTQNKGFKQFPQLLNKFIHLTFAIFKGFFKVILFIIGLIALVASSVLLVVFVASMLFPLSVYSPWAWTTNIDPVAFIFPAQALFIKIGAVLVIGVPLFFILFGALRVLFHIPYRNRKFIRITGLLLWIGGLFMLGNAGLNIKKDFNEEAQESNFYELKSVNSDTLHIQFAEQDFEPIEIGDAHFELDDATWNSKKGNEQLIGKTKIYIKPTTDSIFTIKLKKYASDKDLKSAEEEVANINYDWQQINDTLTLNEFFSLKNKSKNWKHQRMRLYLYVPTNKAISFTQNIRHKRIYGINRYVRKNTPHVWTNKNDRMVLEKEIEEENEDINNNLGKTQVEKKDSNTVTEPITLDKKEIDEMKKELEDI